jgi:hypothetical protein
MVIYPLAQARTVLRPFDEFSRSCPDTITTLCALLIAPSEEPAVAVAACYSGPLGPGETILSPLGRLGAPLFDGIGVRSYIEMQALFDAAWPVGRLYYLKSGIVRDFSEAAIDVYIQYAAAMPTLRRVIAFQQLHGAASRVGIADTAFPHRFDHYSLYIEPATDEPAQADSIVSCRSGRRAAVRWTYGLTAGGRRIRTIGPSRVESICLDTVLPPGAMENLFGKTLHLRGTGSSNPSSSSGESVSLPNSLS